MKNVTIRMPPKLLKALRTQSIKEGKSLSELVRDVLLGGLHERA